LNTYIDILTLLLYRSVNCEKDFNLQLLFVISIMKMQPILKNYYTHQQRAAHGRWIQRLTFPQSPHTGSTRAFIIRRFFLIY